MSMPEISLCSIFSDAGLGHARGVGQLGLGEPGRGAHPGIRCDCGMTKWYD